MEFLARVPEEMCSFMVSIVLLFNRSLVKRSSSRSHR